MPYKWLLAYWVPSALCMGLCLILLTPVLMLSWNNMQLLIFLQTPIYMLHQVEEHTGDRFRTFVNARVFGGVEAMRPVDILWINIPGVWGVTLASLYAAAFLGVGWGLAAVYLVLVNGIAHAVGAAVGRSYNPGLWTSLALFLPLSAITLWRASSSPEITALHHEVGLAIAVAIHVKIIVDARLRARRLIGLQF